jgi:NhaP-type Na+/H+ or K+/H+ antiporter
MPDVISMQVALTLGAIAAATAPAATLLVVKQYKAMGSVTDVLLPVVALDDAVGLMIFAISFGIAQTLNTGTLSVYTLIIEPILSIIFSLLLGAGAAVLLTKIQSYFKSYSNRLVLVIGTVILSIAIAKITFSTDLFSVSFSPLLVCMMLGTVFCNICPDSDELMQLADRWANPILVLFFVFSGAELNLDVFKDKTIIMIGVIYIISRCIGKYYGARISATIANSPSEVRKYLGITLFPQAGVALGMSAIAATSLGADGLLIRNITLFGVLIYELFGPVLTKNALIKSGDIKEITPS